MISADEGNVKMDEQGLITQPKELTDQQRALYESLSKLDPKIAGWYYGAIMVLGQQNNPERLVQAAHSIREIMEKMPRYIDVKIKRMGGNLGGEFNNFVQTWEHVTSKSSCCNEGKWNGEIDKPLFKGLKKLDKLVTWHKENRPRIKKITTDAFRKLDGSKMFIPEPLEQLNVNFWLKTYDFFQAVSHHHQSTTEEEFNGWVNAFERFLLDRLSPRTFEDFKQIDMLIKEGEGDD